MAFSCFTVETTALQLKAELLVVMPIYNEEATIVSVVNEWVPVLRETGVPFTIVMLNDGSRDSTLLRLQEIERTAPLNFLVVDKLNSGHGLTCRLGYDIAAASSAKWVLQIDSDGQCDPTYFPEFWQHREQADCIFGARKTRGDGWLRTVTSVLCSAISSVCTGTSLKDANVPYRLLRREVLTQALGFIPRCFNVQNVALSVTLRRLAGMRWTYVPIHFRDRQGGTNSINVRQVAKLGIEMLVQLPQLRSPH